MKMKKFRGFLLKHRITVLFRRFFRRNFSTEGYRRLDSPSPACKGGQTVSRLVSSWGHHLKTKAKAICSRRNSPGHGDYKQIGQESEEDRVPAVPKGHLAVYVGQKDGEFQRVLVPVIYFNHPLFVELLREAEEEYGFNHPGGITIPCRISEFESVRTRIKSCRRPRKKLTSKQRCG